MSREVPLRRSCFSFWVFALILFANPAYASQKPEIVNVRGQVQGRQARVQFTLRNAFSPEMVEALKSGIEISFMTTVYVERVHRNWFDETLGEVKFWRSVRYDALARIYRLNRGSSEESLPDVISALSGMTQYDIVVTLREDSQPGKRYKAHARTRLDKVGLSEPFRSIFFFTSLWDVETDWARGYLQAP
jgi:hypothetical protein